MRACVFDCLLLCCFPEMLVHVLLFNIQNTQITARTADGCACRYARVAKSQFQKLDLLAQTIELEEQPAPADDQRTMFRPSYMAA